MLIGYHRAPPNCSFEIDDVENEWLYKPSEAFTFIHSRDMAGSIKDSDKLFAQAFKHLQPGGYLEMQSFEVELYSDDDTLKKAQDALQWKDLLIEASNKFGKPLNVEGTWREKMTKAGFVDIKNEEYKVCHRIADRSKRRRSKYPTVMLLPCFCPLPPINFDAKLRWYQGGMHTQLTITDRLPFPRGQRRRS